ncbi:hypothetical protein Dsin_015193 [Dipteronia sinensis]|uniref:LOB domain-containing protein n=1 Tax=Dipteronia sinensis TaxID=43782 RepID=A0AAE0E4J2_9ROSI|nr:hypothetical protein Dsin_015193 [Dipteronia sinensis]
MAGAENNPQPCAVCRHQRRRCDQNCETAPYFPVSTCNDFHNAHKLFGVSKIQKILHQVPQNQRQATVESILRAGTKPPELSKIGRSGRNAYGTIVPSHFSSHAQHMSLYEVHLGHSSHAEPFFSDFSLAMSDSMLNLEPTMDPCKPGYIYFSILRS